MEKHMRWADTFSTGHTQIDNEHRALVDDLNAIAADFSTGRGEDAYARCREFRANVEKHFEMEGRILQDVRFPRLDEHIKSHDQFSKRLEAYCMSCGQRCRQNREEQCMLDLSLMLAEHFVRGDLDFKSHLEYHGLAET